MKRRKFYYNASLIALALGSAFVNLCCSGSHGNAPPSAAAAGDSPGVQATTGTASDDFERPTLGSDWAIIFPGRSKKQVTIVDHRVLGMGPGPQGFFLVNWRGNTFNADQFCEATIPEDVTDGWIHMVYVRWRARDGARYGFTYDNDPGHAEFGNWIFKYDGIPTKDTRIIASTPAQQVPGPGDTIRIEVEDFTLRGYLNGNLVLTATDTHPTRISNGETGLAARWATGNRRSKTTSRVWGSWRGGNLGSGQGD